MSESTNEPDQSRDQSTGEPGEPGVISDEQLPEDLQAEKNPLARDPDDSDSPAESPADSPADTGSSADQADAPDQAG